MELDAYDMSVNCSGWYEEGKWISEMKEDKEYPKINDINNVFIE